MPGFSLLWGTPWCSDSFFEGLEVVGLDALSKWGGGGGGGGDNKYLFSFDKYNGVVLPKNLYQYINTGFCVCVRVCVCVCVVVCVCLCV